jgi:tetratricopeptide (TPR) repeat protein
MTSIGKLKDRARKHEQQEDWKAAIEAYRKVLETEQAQDIELDLGLLNRVGDLYLRLGQIENAVEHYEQAADKYAESGFYNNAIALCNKVLRHRPDRPEVYLKLSRYCQDQGFTVDARRWILGYAERQVKRGDVDAALQGLADFAAASGDPDVRELLAQHLASHDRNADAVGQLREAHAEWRRRGDTAAAERAAEQARVLDPDVALDVETRDVVRAPAGLPGLDDAIEPTPTPGPEESGEAEIPMDAGGVEGFESHLVEPPPPEPAAFDREDIETFDEPLEDEEEEPEPLPLLDDEPDESPGLAAPEVDTLEPEPLEIEAPEPFEAEEPEPVEEEQREPFEGEEAEPVVVEEPEPEPEPVDIDGPEPMDAGEPEPPELPEPLEETEPLEAEEMGPVGVEEPELVGFEEPEPLDVGAVEPAEPSEPAEPEPLEEPEPLGADEVELVEPGPVEPEPVEPEPLEPEPVEPEPVAAESPSGFSLDLDLESGLGEHEVKEPVFEEDTVPPEPGIAGMDLLDLEKISFDLGGEGSGGEPIQPEDLDVEVVMDRAKELVSRGLSREAGRELRLLSKADPGPEVFRQVLPIANEIVKQFPDDIDAHQQRVDFASKVGDREIMVETYLDLGAALARSGAEAKARAIYQRVLSLEPGNETARAVVGDAPEADQTPVDLEAILREIPAEETPEPGPESGPVDEAFVSQLSQFQARIDGQGGSGDAGDHYDLGIAFKEMGLIDEAIAEFQTALKDGEERLKVYEELGHCIVLKGQYNVALKVFKRALQAPRQDDAELLGVHYFIGQCYEELGQRAEARAAYEKVLAIDPGFGDVPARVGRL